MRHREASLIRALMRKWFPVALNIPFVISLAAVVITGVSIMTTRTFEGYLTGQGLLFMVAGVICVTLLYGGFYLLLDIRDAIEKRNQ